ncbi:UDP-N-acetylglucosamine 1-carboxyvinyltransferase [Psittacicella gerlachiana]|uniref:UDP-N-acetylglucosamine 1-carboxyvinyltransferase n=1 Tax=Psittacicella gerlachiana TaxID=2028574 RepID=A0A3A1Y2Y5_9GAMM|nr:UDP-N-acetylglucosamine 1-carboxyvinyltransferase [Psittacicella gerlachiana]RIY31578.1 UDP-N-acetylglucosamine 1-carboxyvinyltransferase [Psittacicella gerlachiana]
MEHFIIHGKQIIGGEISIGGAKNAALPIFFASILANAEVELANIPNLTDIRYTCDIFVNFGAKLSIDLDSNKVSLQPQHISNPVVPYELASKMRASIWALAPLVAKFGTAKVSLPGGCAIGSRPVDMHLEALKKLGVKIEFAEGYVIATSEGRLKGANIFFDKVSVGATVSAVCAAVLAQGVSRIENVAMEPEVVDLCNFLVALGAKIDGIGTKVLTITGVESLGGVANYRIIPDRIECGTYLIAAAISKSKVTCHNIIPEHLEATLSKLEEAGAKITVSGSSVTCDMEGKRAKAVNIVTAPYPGVATDMQAQFTLLNTVAEGVGIVTETIFENRFMHVPELQRMGAKITQSGNTIHVQGVEELSGAHVKATDLRASISLVLAGCIAQGTTHVDEIYHIDRGYEFIEERMKSIGCIITRERA